MPHVLPEFFTFRCVNVPVLEKHISFDKMIKVETYYNSCAQEPCGFDINTT